MKNKLRLLVSILSIVFLLYSCGKSTDNTSDVNVEENDNSCSSVKDCLDKNNFEAARTYCAEDGEDCDKKSIIELESQFWLNQNEFIRAQKIALEIYAIKNITDIEKNNFYSEKLNDIIAASVIENKFEIANQLEVDFPVEINGDKTLKFKIDALKTIANGYAKSNLLKEKSSILMKLKPLELKYKIAKTAFEKDKKESIRKLNQEIAKLEIERNAEIKNLKKEIKPKELEKKTALVRLAEIQKDFYIFSSRREEDLSAQNKIINGIESEINNIKNTIETYNLDKINSIKENIELIKKKSFED